ncbi:conserved hypothetical protein [Ricinus communis]|uniref:Uncharacterized protein n=1 Tax=Ricinus communis TaxID=3988 RepID=B9SAW8_RICCO|nr:conserved hypothetical protein [Ricinus communis]
MSNAITRTRSCDRFCNPPPIMIQKQLQRALNTGSRVYSDESALCISNSLLPNADSYLTNLDRIIESITPTVRAQNFAEEREIKKEKEKVKGYDVLYYVPSLSGIQLYVEPSRDRRHGEDSDFESSQEASCAGGNECEAEKQAKGGVDGVWGRHRHNIMNLNPQGLQRLSLRDQNLNNLSSSHGLLVFEYLEQEQPRRRKPLYDTVSTLASEFPDIKTYRSCDLSPASWVSIAWYPIYRIPMGPMLQNLDASFLTFHSLSTHSRSKNPIQFDMLNARTAYGMVSSSKTALPVFGLASYKLQGSILTSGEWEQASSLLQAAVNWLQHLEVNSPDFQFFASHN